ncbi:MAG: Flp pilus assembly protein CpaB [Vicinamibacterales bacterium]
MNRSLRTLLVVLLAVGLAGASTYLVYKTIQSRPVREVEVAHSFAIVAAKPLSLGARLTAADVKRVPWPVGNPVPGSFTTVEEVVDRGVIAPIDENAPLSANNVAPKDGGVGLPPTIPRGMRAISVRVNEVIGVAGFVVPGTRVDVMVIQTQSATKMARVIVNNVQVLTAGTRYDQEVAREGKALPSSVVTLMVNPSDAELIGLAASEGQIMLTLRNPLDNGDAPSEGTYSASLAGLERAPMPGPSSGQPARRVAAAPPPMAAAAPAPPPAAKPVVVIRAGVIKEIIK